MWSIIWWSTRTFPEQAFLPQKLCFRRQSLAATNTEQIEHNTTIMSEE